MGAATTVDSEDLAGDVGRLEQQEAHRAGDVARAAFALQQGVADDGGALGRRELVVVRPFDRPRGDAVHPHLGRELERERAGEAGEAGLRGAVQRIVTQRPLGVDVDDVDDGAAAAAQLVKAAVKHFDRLDALVNNASSFFPTPVGEITERAWDDLIGTNLKAPLFLAQAAAPHLKKTQGSIVNITDIHGERPLKHFVVYSVAKAGLIGLTRSLARELGPDVRVNGVSPGPVLWPEDDSFDAVARQRVIAHTLLKRAGEPEDIARAVYFFVADAPYVTGQIVAVDGGRSVNL